MSLYSHPEANKSHTFSLSPSVSLNMSFFSTSLPCPCFNPVILTPLYFPFTHIKALIKMSESWSSIKHYQGLLALRYCCDHVEKARITLNVGQCQEAGEKLEYSKEADV